MLARANRVLHGDDFRRIVRRGARVSTAHSVVYLVGREADEPTRFGFIISKAVGGAVERNLVRRRLRSIARDLLVANTTGKDFVVRALPGVHDVSWATLQGEIFDGVERSVNRR